MIDHLDRPILATDHEEACVHFYVELLGIRLEAFAQDRKAFIFSSQKINLHIRRKELELKAYAPTPGTLDLCSITTRTLGKMMETFQTHGVKIVEGPVACTGATGPIRSVYVRDPDLSLIEIAAYPADSRTQLYSGKAAKAWRMTKITRINE